MVLRTDLDETGRRTSMTAVAADCPAEALATPKSSQAPDDCRYAGLMRAAQDGDNLAYATLLRELLPLLRRWVQGRLRFLQAADVEDIVQDTLLSLHAARATYDPARPFLPWLSSITHNRLVDGVRRNARRSANEFVTDELPVGIADETRFTTDSYGDPEALRAAVQQL